MSRPYFDGGVKQVGALLWSEPKDFTLLPAVQATGAGASVDLGGRYASLLVQVTGTFTGTVSFEASQDGVNFVVIQGTDKNSGTATSEISAAGLYEFRVNGVKKFRANVTALTSGVVTASGTASPMAL